MKPSASWTLRAAAVGVVSLACGNGADKHPPDTAAAARLVGSSAPGTRAVEQAAAPLPGALTKSIDQYSGDELFALTHRITYTGGNERPRRCRGLAACRGLGPTRSTRIRVDAVANEDSLTARTLPASGVVAARALNRGAVADTMYGMAADTVREYYLIVLPNASHDSATWRLEELVTSAGRRSHRMIHRGRFTECHHPFVRGARADFKTCAEAAAVRPASFSRLQGTLESPIWVACAGGCCTADTDGT